MATNIRTVGTPPSEWLDRSAVGPVGEMGPHFVTHDPNNTPQKSTVIKVGAVVLAFFLTLTLIGIPLAAYLLGRVDSKPPKNVSEMDVKKMQRVFEHAVVQHNEAGYLNASKAKAIGESHDAPKSLALAIQEGENIGVSRPTMEDAKFHIENDRRLVMGVFDGHGGSRVSEYAAEQFEARIDDYVDRARGNIELAMQRLVNDIHAEVLLEGFSDGSTGVISYLDKASNRLYTATLGDSEANIYREVDGEMVSIPLSLTQNWTLDSELERLSEASGIPKNEILERAEQQQDFYGMSVDKIIRAVGNQNSNQFNGPNVSRAIGDAEWDRVLSRKVEVTSVQVKPGDTIILACDGLKDYATEEQIVQAVEAGNASPAELIDMAKEGMVRVRGGDNVTVITVKVEKAPAKEAEVKKAPAEDAEDAEEDYGFEKLEKKNMLSTQKIIAMDEERMLTRLRTSQRLGGETVIAYAKHLQRSLEFEFVPNLLPEKVPEASEVLDLINDAMSHADNKPVFIPVILERGNDHIVLITIDPVTKKVEYFDSQGKALVSEKRKIKGLGMTPAQLVASLELEDYETVSNTKRYQGLTDWVNCGVYVSQFMEARAAGSFEEACSAMKLSPKMARSKMIDELST